jgi:flagellar P-ring protein precursor FlgI
MTPLRGADDQIYAMAQGNLVVGGLGVSAADGSQVTVNVPSAGRIPGGASVERAVDTGFASAAELIFNLSDQDLTTAGRVADAINREIGQQIARAVNGGSIAIAAPQGAVERTALMGRIENILVEPGDAAAKVIVNSRTGTVVINGAVRIAPAAVSHGRLTVQVEENPQVVQPNPMSRGQTAVQQNSTISVEEERARMFALDGGASLSEIVRAINAIGATPSDLVAILEALKQAGALRAELVVL